MVKNSIKKMFPHKNKDMEMTIKEKFDFIRLQKKAKEFKRHGKGVRLSFNERRELNYYLYLRAKGIRKIYLFIVRKISFLKVLLRIRY